MKPAYIDHLSFSDLKDRAERLKALMKDCTLCPRECGARRLEGRYGVCRTTHQIAISSASTHYGEEPPLVGTGGSGTIFFTSCNLKCLFCQNFEISHQRIGRIVSTQELAQTMLSLQRAGCHNINLVTPTHVVPRIVEALILAVQKGLCIPIVYNCGGYESVKTLELLDGIIDIYMPDIKYSENDAARKYSGAKDYWDIVRPAVKEMHRQVGCLEMDREGIAVRGLLIRHLVLPNNIAGSRQVLDYIANDLSVDSYVNIMDQYRPAFHASNYHELSRRPTNDEYRGVVELARDFGLHRGF
jgi:putative pyruvate formate lyase activating enzyme